MRKRPNPFDKLIRPTRESPRLGVTALVLVNNRPTHLIKVLSSMVAQRPLLVDHLSTATIRDRADENGFVFANCMFPSMRWNGTPSLSRWLP